MDSINRKTVAKIAGAFIAWVIGAGFATGQEVLQFFSSYGYGGYGVIAINLVGFIGLGYFLMRAGFEHREDERYNHYTHFCGKYVGTFYTFLATVTLLLLMPVLISGAGATLYEYYGIPTAVGSALMAGLVLIAYLVGFERLVKIISCFGPAIIAFSLLAGVITLFRDIGGFSAIPSYEETLSPYRAAPHWTVSGLLYLGLNVFPASAYFSKLGGSASNKKELLWGAALGSALLMLSVAVMSTAIMLNGSEAANLEVPVLYLARRISYIFGAVFSVVLVLGIFSSCSVMMWSVCSRIPKKRKWWNPVGAVAIALFSYLVSLLSFGKLIGTFYPLIGYAGLVFLACVAFFGIKNRKNISNNKPEFQEEKS